MTTAQAPRHRPRDQFAACFWRRRGDSLRSFSMTAGDAVQPSWSPSGRRIAYWSVHRGGQRDLWTIDVSGGTAVSVTEDAAVD
ncbi:MAG TPA: hypothetical protein VGB07_32810 [Blastocatellia bacterium]